MKVAAQEEEPVFTRWQLFVAASRVCNTSQLHIAINRTSDQMTGNVIHFEILNNWLIDDKSSGKFRVNITPTLRKNLERII